MGSKTPHLTVEAMRDLAKAGYEHHYTERERNDGWGGNVEVFLPEDKPDDPLFVLIQARSHQPAGDRYMVGFMASDLPKVNLVVAWFDGEPTFFVFPADWLKAVLEKHDPTGTQWIADIEVSKRTLSPRASGGTRYDIGKYAVSR